MEEATAKKQLSSQRGWLTRAARDLEKEVEEGGKDEAAYAVLSENLEKRLVKFEEAQFVVEQFIKEEADLEAVIDEANVYLRKIRKVRIEVGRIRQQLRDNKDGGGGSTEVDVYSFGGNKNNVRLPRIELPKFNGDITRWQSFWDKFIALVDKSDLPKISKFTYLESLLEGDAKDVIAGFSVTDEHYDAACKMLEHRFGRKERIIFAHIQSLLRLSSTYHTHKQRASVPQLHKLYDDLASHVRSLDALDITGTQYGVVLTPVVLACLPSDVRMEWARDGEGHEADLQHLLAFLSREIKRQERSEIFKEVVPTTTREEKRNIGSSSTTAALQSSSKGQPRSGTFDWRLCGFCHGKHRTERCHGVLELSIGDRKRRIFGARLCFRCLGPHFAKDCLAVCVKCKGGHHVLCCEPSERPGIIKSQAQSHNAESKSLGEVNYIRNSDHVSHVSVSHVGGSAPMKGVTVLPTARVYVRGANGLAEANLLFDTGSDRTYISSSLVKKIRPKWVQSEPIAFAAFGGGKSQKGEFRNVYDLHLSNMSGNESIEHVTAVEVPVICVPLERPQIPQRIVESFSGIQFADNLVGKSIKSIDILVGIDWYWDLMKPGLIKHREGPVAQETIFGWVLSGCLREICNVHTSLSHQLMCLNDISESTIRSFWDLDAIGITGVESKVADPVLEKFKQTVEFKDGRYEVSLPWKDDFQPDNLLNNEYQARKRLKSLSAKLARDPELHAKYDAALEYMEDNGIIEDVPFDEGKVSHPVFYLPHRPVIKETSHTTKIRPVFDASASGANGVSLNDCLEAGPSLNPDIVEILIRFRRWPISLTADITKAFLQIRVCPQDRDVHRFLWGHHGNVRTMRFRRVPFGNCSSPFLLNATIKHHLADYPSSDTIEELNENLYVDDFLSGADSDEKAWEMFSEARRVLGAGNFALSQWNSNSRVVSEMFFQEFGSKQVSRESLKVLGMKWISSRDVFSFDGIKTPTEFLTTKRLVLSFLARLYDPLGLIAPFVMTVKILFQEIWRLGLQWDEEVPVDLHRRFVSWLEGIECLKTWEIPRCYFPGCAWKELENVTLEVFCDSSERGYGACVYLKALKDDGSFLVSLIVSKARVAPIKKVTLPRLELLGALLGARLLTFAQNALKLDGETKYRCWSDSTIVLAWIRSRASQFKAFVGNRIGEIQELTNPACWFHVGSKQNPADLLTRGLPACNLVTSKLWLQGPILLSEEADVPNEKMAYLVDHREEELLPSNTSSDGTSLVAVCKVTDAVLPMERWGSFGKALRITGLVLRFIGNLKSSKAGHDKLIGPLSYHEVCRAKLKLLKCVQFQYYSSEISCLERSCRLPKDSKISSLSPILGENGLLRVGGRLQMSNLSYEEKHPVILPKCHLSELLIRNQHELLNHAGVGTLVSSLRGSYWIIGIRRSAKTVKRSCIPCQKLDARSCNQPAAPLPGLRVKEAPPFSVIGLDYAGPLYCIDQPTKKLYILLFTCAVVRAVHLEITESMSLSDFMMALRRFAARRGLPSIIYSDNAKTFLAAKFELLKTFGHLSPHWKFIVPRAPWWGGFYERLVGSVKTALKKSLGNRRLTKVELETSLCEIEASVNSRPLTFMGDSMDSLYPLTPSHFLIGRSAGFVPTVVSDDLNVDSLVANRGDLQEREFRRISRLRGFWSVWHKEYLRNLPAAISKFTAKGTLRAGSIVLIREDNVKRLKWPLAQVIALHPGCDGLARSASLKTAKGIITRPVQRLHNLEMANWAGESIFPNPCAAVRSGGFDDAMGDVVSTEHSDGGPSGDVTEPHVDPVSIASDRMDAPVHVSSRGRVIKPVRRLDL